MPQIFRMGEYWIYFWTNPSENATKVWITSAGNCLHCNNNSRIPSHTLRNIMRMIEARSADIIQKWFAYFGEISYYC